jgi:cardiolipin synthase
LHRVVDWATRAHVGPLLEAGVRIWLDRPPFDHSKLMVACISRLRSAAKSGS